jgi:hypothetical protein
MSVYKIVFMCYNIYVNEKYKTTKDKHNLEALL